jgi:hypothetical protein
MEMVRYSEFERMAVEIFRDRKHMEMVKPAI